MNGVIYVVVDVDLRYWLKGTSDLDKGMTNDDSLTLTQLPIDFLSRIQFSSFEHVLASPGVFYKKNRY